jgi:hypothetical protein
LIIKTSPPCKNSIVADFACNVKMKVILGKIGNMGMYPNNYLNSGKHQRYTETLYILGLRGKIKEKK